MGSSVTSDSKTSAVWNAINNRIPDGPHYKSKAYVKYHLDTTYDIINGSHSADEQSLTK